MPSGDGALAWRALSALGGALTLIGLVLVAAVFVASLYRGVRRDEPESA